MEISRAQIMIQYYQFSEHSKSFNMVLIQKNFIIDGRIRCSIRKRSVVLWYRLGEGETKRPMNKRVGGLEVWCSRAYGVEILLFFITVFTKAVPSTQLASDSLPLNLILTFSVQAIASTDKCAISTVRLSRLVLSQNLPNHSFNRIFELLCIFWSQLQGLKALRSEDFVIIGFLNL